MESSASDENEASIRDKKNVDVLSAQHVVPAPLRRHHLKFGVLGKRHSFAYPYKRNEGRFESRKNIDVNFNEIFPSTGNQR